MGGIVTMQGAAVGAAFGRASFGRVMGAMFLPMSVIHLGGTPFAGWVSDTSGSYDWAFYTLLTLYVLAGVAVFSLRVNTRSNRS